MDTKPEDLKKAYKKEKDIRIKVRMVAVNMVVFNNESIAHTADLLMQCPDWVSSWVKHFREEGLEGLRDLPRIGWPPKVSLKEINKFSQRQITSPRLRYSMKTSTKNMG